jgi:quinol monooxygenase YgiN
MVVTTARHWEDPLVRRRTGEQATYASRMGGRWECLVGKANYDPLVILEATAKKGSGMELVETLRALLPDTRNKDGCQGVDVTTNLDNPDNLVLVQRWETRKHYENYLAWRRQRGHFDKFAAPLAEPPSIRYFDLTSV